MSRSWFGKRSLSSSGGVKAAEALSRNTKSRLQKTPERSLAPDHSTPRAAHHNPFSGLSTSPIACRQLDMDGAVADPQACLEVFKSHWDQARQLMVREPGASKKTAQDDTEAVIRYVDHMILLLMEEESGGGGQGPILEYLLTEDILEQLLAWSSQAEHTRLHQLRMYDQMISEARQELLVHKPVIRPLLKLLSASQQPGEHQQNSDIEYSVVLVLHHVCVHVTKCKQLLELLFDASPSHGPAKFLVFSLLITYIHREGDVGQQARDALLLIMSLSSVHDDIGLYIADNSDFCPVLATGLSGLYSSLPRKLDYPSDDWYQLTSEDISNSPDLVQFLNSLDFCNAVVQVAHPLVRDQLLQFIYNGFLVPVLGPALHQTSVEEVIGATAYIELFLRRINEPALLRTFLKFVLTGKHDDVVILDSLIRRVNSNSRLCMVTLCLFWTLIDLNCEDVMFQLVFKYLIPCSHVMVSQRRAVRDLDLYSKTAEKLLSLRPACCMSESTDPLIEVPADNISIDSTSSSQDGSTVSNPDQFETSYLQYLKATRSQIERCSQGCKCWSLPYDGENPPLDSLSHGSMLVLPPRVSPGTREDEATLALVNGSTETSSQRGTDSDQRGTDSDQRGTDSDQRGTDSDQRGTDSDQRGTGSDQRGTGSDQRGTDSDQRMDSDMVCVSDKQSEVVVTKQASHISSTLPNGPLQVLQQRSDSVSSEVDSAFSTGSAPPDNPPCLSRGDSPLLTDNFGNADFGAFLRSLKRITTPVEVISTIEDSVHEIETIASEIQEINTGSSTADQDSPPALSQFTDQPPNTDVCPKPAAYLAQTSVTVREPSPSQQDQKLNPVSLQNGDSSSRLDLRPEGSSYRAPSPLLTPLITTAGGPNIGPFLSTLLTRLEMMMQNTLYVNLLLTGVVTRLACYPQPLLRSFLLNHTLVFQPTVKSLIQVLGSVKQKVDCFTLTVKSFDDLMMKARHFLTWREEVYLFSIGELPGRRISSSSFPGALLQGKAGPNPEPHREKRNSIRELFRSRSKPRMDPRLQLLADKQGFRYLHQKSPTSPPGSAAGADTMAEQLEALKTKNCVYCALVLDEFLKELAAISQEHAVVNV